MKVTLITLQDDLHCFGLRCIASVLKSSGVDTRVLFLDRWGARAMYAYQGADQRYPDCVLERVAELCAGSDLIGFSVMTLYYKESARMTDYLKRNLGVPVIWGGIHPLCEPAESLKHADMVCMGEAEDTILDVVERISSGRQVEGVPGVWYRKNGKVIAGPVRHPGEDLDKYPLPFTGIEDSYVFSNGDVIALTREELIRRWSYHYMTINARGCVMRCTYCCNSQLAKRFDWSFVRRKSVPRIIEELKCVVSAYPELKRIKLSDDAFGDLDVQYIKEFASAYKKEIGLPLGIPGFSPQNMSEEKLAPLVDAGLEYTRLGIQSGSSGIRKLYGRHESNDQIVDAVSIVQKFMPRIKKLKLDMITDNPWETEEDVLESIRLLLRLSKPYHLVNFSLTMYPGTPLYIKAKREGIIDQGGNAGYARHFYNIDKTKRLNRILDLFTKPVVLKDKIEGMIAVYNDPEEFERRYSEYIEQLTGKIEGIPATIGW